jgi:3-oxoacyl-[acyl-carrier-protein] synthase II
MKAILTKPPPIPKIRRVVVTGMGAITPIGCTVDTFWNNLINSKCGIQPVKFDVSKYTTQFDPKQIPAKIAGMINPDEFKYESLFKDPPVNRISKNIQYAIAAAKQALIDANWNPTTEEEKLKTGIAIGSAVGGLEETCFATEALNNGEYRKISPFSIPKILVNLAAGWISVQYGLKGPNHSVSTACATGGHSIGDAFRFIKYDNADVMVCGGTESTIHPVPMAGFCRMNALSTNFNDTPLIASRPFDKDRSGFVMGEGCGILILEELEHAKRRGAKIYCELRGYGLSGDGTHITTPTADGSGAANAMKRGLVEAGLLPEHVQYINAHATSTPAGDRVEYTAIKNAFGTHCKNLSVSSIKGSIGHLLGASGAVEAIATILALKNNTLPPNLNFGDLDADLSQDKEKEMIITKTKQQEVHVALSNSFGFGGTNTSLVFAKYE